MCGNDWRVSRVRWQRQALVAEKRWNVFWGDNHNKRRYRKEIVSSCPGDYDSLSSAKENEFELWLVIIICAASLALSLCLVLPLRSSLLSPLFFLTREAYKTACLNVTDSDWEALGHSALSHRHFEIARKAYIRTKNWLALELIQNPAFLSWTTGAPSSSASAATAATQSSLSKMATQSKSVEESGEESLALAEKEETYGAYTAVPIPLTEQDFFTHAQQGTASRPLYIMHTPIPVTYHNHGPDLFEATDHMRMRFARRSAGCTPLASDHWHWNRHLHTVWSTPCHFLFTRILDTSLAFFLFIVASQCLALTNYIMMLLRFALGSQWGALFWQALPGKRGIQRCTEAVVRLSSGLCWNKKWERQMRAQCAACLIR